MALTVEQQAQVDFQLAISEAQTTANKDLEQTRHANQMALQAKQAKLEAVRLAKDVLIENARSKPADSREITPAEIAAFAAALDAHINA